MKTTRNQGKHLPQVHIGLNDARVLLTMVTAYLLYLRKAVPPSPKQETRVRVLRGVQQRLAALLASPRQQEDTPIWLTHQELHLLDEAISGYVQLVRTLVPASRQRDETLREIEGFRDTLSGFQATPVMLK
jgi:hypothetical protein